VREDRIARNEVLHREVNERVRQVEQSLTARGVVEPLEEGEYFCECGLDDCIEKVRVRSDEYNDVRAHPARFFVLPDHVIADVETVVARNERFVVVEKHEGEDVLARAAATSDTPEA
jgi:hypothetical protein